MVELIRNIDTRYVYVSYNRIESVTKVRRAAKPDEDVFLCEVVAIKRSSKTENKVLAEEYGIKNDNALDLKFHDYFRYLFNKEGVWHVSKVFDGETYDLAVVVSTGTKLKRTEKDKFKEEQMKKDNYTKNIVNTFYAPSINAVLEKYGLIYDKEKGGIIFEANSFNTFIRNILENNLVKDLAELGIEVKINDKLTADSSQGMYLRKVVYKKDMKIIQEKENQNE